MVIAKRYKNLSSTEKKGEGDLEVKEYPALFGESDSLAVSAEKNYFRLLKSKTLLMILTASIALVASLVGNLNDTIKSLSALVSAISLISVLAVNLFRELRKFDHTWFDSRAVAESVKTETWCYMMNVKPYDGSLISRPDSIFIARLNEILHNRSSISSELSVHTQSSSEITERMRQVKAAGFQDRKDCYVRERLHYQRTWYAERAKNAKKEECRWLALNWVFQFAAVITAVIFIYIGFWVNLAGSLTTMATGALSWSQARRHRELSQSYGLVSQELAFLEEHANQALTEEALANIVIETERTISREHNIWLTRRF